MKNTIVCVASSGPRFIGGLHRLQKIAKDFGEPLIFWEGCFPPGTITGIPYHFKIAAIEEARQQGYEVILWADASTVPVRPLKPLWDLIEEQGYWFNKNYDYTNGQFCCDSALPILGITREEAFKAPQIMAGCFGLDFRKEVAQEWFREWKKLALAGAFNGPWQGGSEDKRVIGHRHDQTCGAHLCWKMGLKLTEPPKWHAETSMDTEETLIRLIRG